MEFISQQIRAPYIISVKYDDFIKVQCLISKRICHTLDNIHHNNNAKYKQQPWHKLICILTTTFTKAPYSSVSLNNLSNVHTLYNQITQPYESDKLHSYQLQLLIPCIIHDLSSVCHALTHCLSSFSNSSWDSHFLLTGQLFLMCSSITLIRTNDVQMFGHT